MNPPRTDPYALLGVTAEATDDDLDHAFRGLVRRLHPDTRTSSEPNADADQQLQELLTAYATLRDPIRRAAYDRARTGPAPTNGAPTARTRTAEPPTSATVRAEPAIRIGPVHWEPSRHTSTATPGDISRRHPGGDRHGH
jgi:curved DNA-binding protein CbpA